MDKGASDMSSQFPLCAFYLSRIYARESDPAASKRAVTKQVEKWEKSDDPSVAQHAVNARTYQAVHLKLIKASGGREIKGSLASTGDGKNDKWMKDLLALSKATNNGSSIFKPKDIENTWLSADLGGHAETTIPSKGALSGGASESAGSSSMRGRSANGNSVGRLSRDKERPTKS
ncbi:hypothetical protein P7C73_g176, partial [Tremellales sp. Uapishka_1]